MSGAEAMQGAGLSVMLDELSVLILRETDLFKAGKVREALADEARKAELSGKVLFALEQAKAAGGLSLSAFQARDFTGRWSALEALLGENLAAITTLRGVAESLLRDVSQAIAPPPIRTYGQTSPGAGGRACSHAPIALSRST